MERTNFLGFQKLNGRMWPEVEYHGIALACPVDVHAWVRPLIVQLNGAGCRWSSPWIAEECAQFFKGRRSIRVMADLKMLVCKLLHRVHLGIELTEPECADFVSLQWAIMKVRPLPRGRWPMGWRDDVMM